MEFGFTDQQQSIADLAESLFRDHGSDEHVRALAHAGQTIDRPLWRRLSETGLLALTLPPADGGSGLGMLELGLVLQQQGRFLAAAPLWTHQLVALAVATHGEPGLRHRVLAALASGERIAALATELDDVDGLRADLGPHGWTLHGHLGAVLLDDFHSSLVLAAQTTQGRRLFLVDCESAGIGRTPGLLTDLQAISDISFDNVQLPLDSALAPPACAWLEPRLACCIAALQLGVLEEALRRAADYVGQRTQFGRPLGSFQALAVRAAAAYIEVELLRSAQWQLAWLLDQGLPAAAAGRVAKHQASQAGHIVGHTAQHFHGGVGADLQYPIHRFYLRSQALSLIGGGAEAQLAHIGRALASEDHWEYQHG